MGHRTEFTYEAKGNLTEVRSKASTGTQPHDIVTTHEYGTFHRLSQVSYKTGESVRYTYDRGDNLLTLTTNDGAQTYTYTHDQLNRVITRNDALLGYKTNPNGITAHRTLDTRNRLDLLTHKKSSTTVLASLDYTYDAEGKLTRRSEGTDSDAFSYGFGSQLKQIQKTRGGTLQQTLSYGYDGNGKRVKVTDSGGTRYFLYDGGMPLLELDTNKKITASYLYGADGVVYRRKHNAVAHWHFDEGNGTVAHDVDQQNHATLASGNAAPAWSLEGGGSLLFDGVNDHLSATATSALNLTGNQLTLACWVKRTANQWGMVFKKSGWTGGYRILLESNGRVGFWVKGVSGEKVTSTSVAPLNQWTHVAARYDGAQMRVFINGVKDSAVRLKTGNLLSVSDPLIFGRDGLVATAGRFHGYLDEVSIYDRALSDAEITNLANNRGGRYEYHHVNALGSNIVLTDDHKNVLVRYEYDGFGAIRSEPGTSDNPRKFTGKEYERDVRLYYYGARYYNPYIGRFTQRDPAGDGVNWYAYAANNPLKFIDPTGQVAILSDSYFNGPNAYIVWDPDIEHFAYSDGSGVTWISEADLVSAIADFVPVIGDAKGFVDSVIGEDLLTGDPLSPVDRFLGLIMLSEVRGAKKRCGAG